MKLIIAGSRTITDIKTIVRAFNEIDFLNCRMTDIKDITEIVSGTAKGVDKLGELFAKRQNIKVKKFPADWDAYGKSAGYRRNAEMAKYADCLLAVWDGKSKGTSHMIDLMKREQKPVFIYKGE